MEDKKSTLLIFVQDETGSMSAIQETTISAFNEYFTTLKIADNGKDLGEVTVHAWQFSESPGEERVRELHAGPLSGVPTLDDTTYRPRGVTPLLDAIGTAMRQAEGVTADRYLFIAQTDGLENASRDFSRADIERMVSEKEAAANWTLVFLGAGIREWKREAATMGAAAGSTTSYSGDVHSTRSAYRGAAGQSVSLLSTDASAMPDMAKKIEEEVEEAEKRKTADPQ